MLIAAVTRLYIILSWRALFPISIVLISVWGYTVHYIDVDGAVSNLPLVLIAAQSLDCTHHRGGRYLQFVSIVLTVARGHTVHYMDVEGAVSNLPLLC